MMDFGIVSPYAHFHCKRHQWNRPVSLVIPFIEAIKKTPGKDIRDACHAFLYEGIWTGNKIVVKSIGMPQGIPIEDKSENKNNDDKQQLGWFAFTGTWRPWFFSNPGIRFYAFFFISWLSDGVWFIGAETRRYAPRTVRSFQRSFLDFHNVTSLRWPVCFA